MSTPIWGPSDPEQGDDGTGAGAPNPYAAPSQPPAGPAPTGGTWNGGTGYPQAPAPSGYEAQQTWTPGPPDPAAPATAAPTSPYGAPGSGAPGTSPYGTQTPGGYGSSRFGSAGTGPATSPYGTGGYAAGGYPTAAPVGSAPYPGGAGPYGTPYPTTWVAPPRTEPLAIASLVTSSASILVGLSGPVGLGLGIAALRRIRREGTNGRGLAIAGIVIGSVFTALMIVGATLAVIFVVAASSSSSSDSDGSTTTSDPWTPDGSDSDTTLPLYTLSAQFAAGTCLTEQPQEYDMSDALVVDCATTHDTEVLSTVELSAPVSEDLYAYDQAYTDAMQACSDQATALLAAAGPLDDLGFVDFYYPHPSQWDAGGRSGYCVLVTDGWVSGSAVAGSLVAGSSLGV
ncbi:MAG TPA: DUF4190 domain-containing protein [Cellulomonas sp.]